MNSSNHKAYQQGRNDARLGRYRRIKLFNRSFYNLGYDYQKNIMEVDQIAKRLATKYKVRRV